MLDDEDGSHWVMGRVSVMIEVKEKIIGGT